MRISITELDEYWKWLISGWWMTGIYVGDMDQEVINQIGLKIGQTNILLHVGTNVRLTCY